jgi:TonB-dependent SusC/RagA subfamily outer membrane receptor
MEALAIYLLKSSLCALIFLGIYWCFFKNETFYHFNRYFLLAGLIASVALPFYTFSYEVNVVSGSGFSKLLQSAKPAVDTLDSWFNIILTVYVTGACILLIRHLIGLSKIKRVINQYGCISGKGYKLVNAPEFKTSFSVFNYIIIGGSSEVSETERKLILEHELAHIKQCHWLDLLISQLFCMVQWFNPFAWLYLHAIKQNHEYLADHAVLQSGNSPAMYRAALINHSLGISAFTFASSFSHFDKLKRINMMRKPASASAKKLAAVVVLPALSLFFWAFARPEVKVITLNKHSATRSVEGTVKDEAVAKKSKIIKPNKLPPLIYLDGIEIESADNINPEDIKSIDVLKDKTAIAVYGEKGKNGVILITSKKAH